MGASINFRGQLFNKDQKPTKQIKDALAETRSYASYLIKSRSPVKTGALKAGWRVEVDVAGKGLQYYNDVPYTIYQEMGTRFFPARAMLSRSLPDIQAYFKESLARRIGKAYDARKERRDRSAEQRDNRRIREGTPRANNIVNNVTISTPTYDALIGNR